MKKVTVISYIYHDHIIPLSKPHSLVYSKGTWYFTIETVFSLRIQFWKGTEYDN